MYDPLFLLLLAAGAAVPAAAADAGDSRSIAVLVHNVRFDNPAAVERVRGKRRIAARRVCAINSTGLGAHMEQGRGAARASRTPRRRC